jgi:hypothetical protein
MNPQWAQTLSPLAVLEPPLRYYLALLRVAATSLSPACTERRPHTRSSSSDRAQLRLVSFPPGRGSRTRRCWRSALEWVRFNLSCRTAARVNTHHRVVPRGRAPKRSDPVPVGPVLSPAVTQGSQVPPGQLTGSGARGRGEHHRQ